MKNILIVNKIFFRLSETFIQRQVMALSAAFEVKLLANEYSPDADTQAPRAERFLLPKGKIWDAWATAMLRRVFKRKMPYNIASAFFLNNLLKKEKISLIHAHFGFRGVQIFPLAKRHHVPLIVSFHGKDASAALRVRPYREQLPGLFDYAKAIILCSPHMVDQLSLHKWMDKVQVIPYGVNTTDFSPPAQKPEGKALRILHAGRLVPKKGVPDLIRVFSVLRKKFENIELHIIGDGVEMDVCRATARDSGVGDTITFYGAQPIAIVKEWMQQADIFVLNSRTDDDGDMEGLPNVLLEAMSCGQPVVTTAHAGIPMAVVDGVTGMLVPEKDNQALQEALEKVILNSPLRQQLGLHARQKIVAEFSLEKMRVSLVSLCEQSLK